MNNITQLNMNDNDKNLEYGKRNNGSHGCLLMGHFCLLHTSLSIESPIHFRPPCCRAGLLHSLSRLFRPPSHVAEQAAQGDHGPQPPSTVWTHRYTTHTWITSSFKIHTSALVSDLGSGSMYCGTVRKILLYFRLLGYTLTQHLLFG